MLEWISLLRSAIELALKAVKLFRSKNTALRFMKKLHNALEASDGDTQKIEVLLESVLNDSA